ncbi:MAG TPA: O-succinylhomoserine sulfhydrylase [Candidatus Nanopelagicaceae bacterium]
MTHQNRPWGYSNTSDGQKPKWELHEDTLAVRAGVARSGFGETGEALYLTSGFTYDSAQQANSAFAEELDHYVYGRFANPTVSMFENRLAAIEGAPMCVGTGSGMSAMFASIACLVSAGDHVVAAASMFSSCWVVLAEILPKWGVTVEFVTGNDPDSWAAALRAETKAVFLETPSNPMLELVDIRMISDLAHKVGATVIVDNVMASPILQKPLALGADVVMYSATKHIDGQGRVLGGAILGSVDYIKTQLNPFVRHTGPSLSPFNAWVLVKSLETMSMRVHRMNESAQAIAEFLEAVPQIKSVNYPGLASHPQHELARRQMSGGGTTLSFEVQGGQEALYTLMNKLRVIDISNNLGDSKSLITHPYSSTHRRLDEQTKAAMGITESLARLSVGLEYSGDLIRDLTEALA